MSPSDSSDHPGSISYHSKSSDVIGKELFFAVSYRKPALVTTFGGIFLQVTKFQSIFSILFCRQKGEKGQLVYGTAGMMMSYQP